MSDKEKICTMCGLSLPATTDYFYKSWTREGVTYLRGMCIECSKQARETYYDKNRPHILDQKKERYRGLQERK